MGANKVWISSLNNKGLKSGINFPLSTSDVSTTRALFAPTFSPVYRDVVMWDVLCGRVDSAADIHVKDKTTARACYE